VEIQTGGPPKDAIQVIDAPTFLPVFKVTRPAATDPVLSLAMSGRGEGLADPLSDVA